MEKDLTVVIPSYNEAKTIEKVIEEVLKTPRVGEVIVVDDGSKDETWEILQKYKDRIRIEQNVPNRGKGYSIRRGIELATKKYFISQDADLELSPSSYELLFKKMDETGADMVNGMRDFSAKEITFISKCASKAIPFLVLILFGKQINDVVCGYKLMETEKYRSLGLNTDRFEIEPEIIVKTIKKHYKIVEQTVTFTPRNFEQGKHVRWSDGYKVAKLLLKYRFKGIK